MSFFFAKSDIFSRIRSLTGTLIQTVSSWGQMKHFFRSPFFPIWHKWKDISVLNMHNGLCCSWKFHLWIIQKCKFHLRYLILDFYVKKKQIDWYQNFSNNLQNWREIITHFFKSYEKLDLAIHIHIRENIRLIKY